MSCRLQTSILTWWLSVTVHIAANKCIVIKSPTSQGTILCVIFCLFDSPELSTSVNSSELQKTYSSLLGKTRLLVDMGSCARKYWLEIIET